MRALTPWEELIGVGYRELEVSREEGWKEKLLLEYKRKKKKNKWRGYQCLVFTCLSYVDSIQDNMSSVDSIQDNTGRKQTH